MNHLCYFLPNVKLTFIFSFNTQHCYDLQIRLAAFGLLCDSIKTTESVTEVDLQLIRLFWPLNMNNQSPSFRQQAGAHFKKVLDKKKALSE